MLAGAGVRPTSRASIRSRSRARASVRPCRAISASATGGRRYERLHRNEVGTRRQSRSRASGPGRMHGAHRNAVARCRLGPRCASRYERSDRVPGSGLPRAPHDQDDQPRRKRARGASGCQPVSPVSVGLVRGVRQFHLELFARRRVARVQRHAGRGPSVRAALLRGREPLVAHARRRRDLASPSVSTAVLDAAQHELVPERRDDRARQRAVG